MLLVIFLTGKREEPKNKREKRPVIVCNDSFYLTITVLKKTKLIECFQRDIQYNIHFHS